MASTLLTTTANPHSDGFKADVTPESQVWLRPADPSPHYPPMAFNNSFPGLSRTKYHHLEGVGLQIVCASQQLQDVRRTSGRGM